jgi:hypothetical protein
MVYVFPLPAKKDKRREILSQESEAFLCSRACAQKVQTGTRHG